MKKTVYSGKAPEPVGPYSQGVIAGGFLFISGQGPINPETKEVEYDDIKTQTRRVLENVKAILEAADLTMGDVVKCSVFLADIKDFKEMNEVYNEYFAEGKPARTTVEVSNLPLDISVEIDAIALVKQ